NNYFPGIEIAGAWGSTAGSTVGASRQSGEPIHGGATDTGSVWYTWKAPYAAQVELSSCENTSPGVVLDVYTGDFVGSLPRVAHETLSCENGVRIRFKTVADRTYRIAVAGADA